MNKNLIKLCFLNNLKPETPIYKYIPLKYVAEMFRSKKMRFNRMSEWEDVYENYFLKQRLVHKYSENLIDTQDVIDSCYGQSWSKLPETDSMWRIYSKNKDAIKVKTTAEKLFNIVCKSETDSANVIMANVNYRTQEDIDDEFDKIEKSNMSLSQIGNLQNFIRESLITKRSEFIHEEEVRIVKMLEVQPNKNHTAFIEADFKPEDFFEELTIDPRADRIDEDNSRDLLLHVGANPSKIKKSNLYTLKRHTLLI